MNTVFNYRLGYIVILLALCGGAVADEDDYDGGGVIEGAGIGIYLGPNPNHYYYNPYYYHHHDPYHYGNRYIVVPQQHHHSAAQPTTAQGILAMKAQVQLLSLGYYKGEIDGIIGPESESALKSFQHDKGLAETGTLDDATLKALGVDK